MDERKVQSGNEEKPSMDYEGAGRTKGVDSKQPIERLQGFGDSAIVFIEDKNKENRFVRDEHKGDIADNA
ncbi:MAG TPA: hypothetical protein ENH85_05680 [Candidatus Scalindua sp.]|nr:hypothetical protein [Candidatus Scalindua sp.]